MPTTTAARGVPGGTVFRGEPLAGPPGPPAESERPRPTRPRVAPARRKTEWRPGPGRPAEAVDGLPAGAGRVRAGTV